MTAPSKNQDLPRNRGGREGGREGGRGGVVLQITTQRSAVVALNAKQKKTLKSDPWTNQLLPTQVSLLRFLQYCHRVCAACSTLAVDILVCLKIKAKIDVCREHSERSELCVALQRNLTVRALPNIDFITKLGPFLVVVLIDQLPSEEAILSL